MNGKLITDFPTNVLLDAAKPEVEMLDGWNCDISSCRNWNDLPENAKKYIERIEELIGHSIYPVSYTHLLVGSMDLTDNMMIRSYKEGKHFFADRKAPKKLAQEIVDKLEVVTPGVETPVSRLSGGNVQKILVGREIASNPNVLMVAYPVRGLDINSSYTIYNLLNDQKKKGVACLLYTSIIKSRQNFTKRICHGI